ncbi:MAG: ABC transporter permease [Deltaproteobacteria bacterium]|nr:MAG: ABC transporter permease [Deltaproteobacteria bacterium]
MAELYKLAFRNVFRNRRRSIITLSAIALGLLSLVVTQGMMNGLGKQSELNIINYDTGHLKIYRIGFTDDNAGFDLEKTITDPGGIVTELERLPEIKAATGRIIFPALVIHRGESMPAIATGIDLKNDGRVFSLAETVTEGRFLKPGDKGVLVGEKLANVFGIKPGDEIILQARTRAEADEISPIQALDLEVVGIISTGNPKIDGLNLFLPLSLTQESMRMPNMVTDISLRLSSLRFLARVEKEINSRLAPGEFEVNTWIDLAQSFLSLHRLKKTGSMIFLAIFVIITAVGIVNTMLMASFERTNEIGMMAALGMKAKEIRRLFLLEGGILGAMGSGIGVFIGSIITYLGEVYGIDLTAIYGDVDMGYPIRGYWYTDLTVGLVISSLLFGIIISVLASYYPAQRAARKEPTEALRHV